MIPPRTITLVLGLSLVIASSWAGTALADDRTIVVAETASAGAEDAAVFKAAARGVKRAIPDAAIADASLADSAFILGCDPGANACRDDVAAQLGYERLVIVSRRGAEVTVAVRARRDGDQRRFSLAQTDKPTLAILESDIAAMLKPKAAGASSSAHGRTPRGALYLGAGGLLAIAVGATMWGLAASTQGDIDDAPTGTLDELRHLRDLEDRGEAYATAGNVLVGVGAAVVVVAGAWIWRRRSERSPAVQVAPAVTPGGAALVMGGAW